MNANTLLEPKIIFPLQIIQTKKVIGTSLMNLIRGLPEDLKKDKRTSEDKQSN